ncbi:MAG: alpha-glucuronidase family glycosyl hydrolase, partial [Armatimonadota bacterium]|nr:alpha-glucuronidase family glycosyl hydrolase [Armatimonadota bacterium]
MIALIALALTCILFLPASAAADALPTTVIVAEDAHRTEALAAEELARYMETAGDREVPVATAPPADEVGAIYVGGAAQCEVPADLAADGFVIERHGADAHLCGVDPRGTLYAAYRYLEEAVGWRWLQPGTSGEALTGSGDPAFPRERIV